jgi:EAL domain-containing protein (putative c-di-GMP-specific phosphodiesterase class I)
MYLSGSKREAMIQPAVAFDPATNTFSVKGGELFIGGGHYASYRDLIADLPDDQDLNRFELLILEKLILASEGLPGKLKFNISPQSFIDTFYDELKVKRLHGLIRSIGLPPERILFELVEKPYEERHATLKEVCTMFWKYGIGFAADDFGVKSQSHQVILDLGIMIREFKLDPMSFRFKANEDQIKFLDNLAFIAYCKRLADNREAVITAEAVDSLDTLQFLMEHRIYQYQSNLFCGKINVEEYQSMYELMQNLPYETFEKIILESGPDLLSDFRHNVFLRARG